MRVLVVDDEPAIRTLFLDILEDLPVEVRTAGGVADALEAAVDGQFDLVISDLNLGPDSGLTLVQALRREAGRAPDVILMSGAWSDSTRARARALGVATWDKPVDVEVVRKTVAAVQSAVGSRQ